MLKECERQGLKITPLVTECGGAAGNIKGWKEGSFPNSKIVIALSVRLNVSTDYLLKGEEYSPTNITTGKIKNNNGIIGTNKGTMTISVGADEERVLTEQESELLRIYNSLDTKRKAELLLKAYEFDK